MALIIDDLPVQTATWINIEAKRLGILPEDLVKFVFVAPPDTSVKESEDLEQEAIIAQLQAWMNEERVI